MENPNLKLQVNPLKAEVVGSKIAGDGGVPHQIWISSIDGQRRRHIALDVTLKIWPLEPGSHEFEVEYGGSSGKIFLKPFTASGKIQAELSAGHRYILKIKAASEHSLVFFFEDQSDGKVVAKSDAVELSGVVLPVFVPR
ncbi:hypothetical protein [Nibricoccus aquaticus]|uniref:hypothetical protein n=1 Tax=Nibricoccus aquaticus TaxID=2576891 RepID=UPI0010FDB6E3|nr:hypothetical protein [Nibricoccus aquaticus]